MCGCVGVTQYGCTTPNVGATLAVAPIFRNSIESNSVLSEEAVRLKDLEWYFFIPNGLYFP